MTCLDCAAGLWQLSFGARSYAAIGSDVGRRASFELDHLLKLETNGRKAILSMKKDLICQLVAKLTEAN